MEDTFSIGSAGGNNLVLKDQSIKSTHVQFLNRGDGFIVKVADREAKLEVNGEATEQINISCGDEIKIGDIDLQVVDPLEATSGSAAPYWSLIADSSWLSGQEFPLHALPGSKITIGRGNQCDLVFAGTHLSRQHAEIEIGKDKLIINDLNSANGTFVNNERIQQAELFPGDKLKLDVYSFRVFGPGIVLPETSTATGYASDLDEDLLNKLSMSRKSWKTRSTSPGNRVEPDQGQNKLFLWISGVTIISLFVVAVILVVGS